MWQRPTIPSPTTEPVSLEQAKRQCRVFHDDDDAYLGELISVARSHVEKYCGALFAERAVDLVADDWSDLSVLPVVPAGDVTAVTYTDADGAEQTIGEGVYELVDGGLRLLRGQNWPAKQFGSRITVSASVGRVPDPTVRHAMLLLISDMYERREPEPSSARSTLDDLLANHREYA
ncbi:MAG: phage head-tail connector protein [Rhizobiaceae bacterium]|nr:phage head-tail connector protein [Rhizobiaceae bacterium]